MPNPKKKIQRKANEPTIVPEENEQRSRRTSTKLVSAASKSFVLQQNPEFQKKFASKAEKVISSESKQVPEKNDIPEKIPKRDKSKPVHKETPKSSKKLKSQKDEEHPKKASSLPQVKENTSQKKRKLEAENVSNKKKKIELDKSPDDSVRRSRRETTRISTLATLNSSNASDVENQSVASSTDFPSDAKNKTKSIDIEAVNERSKRKSTALNSLATLNSSNASDVENQSVASSTDFPSGSKNKKKSIDNDAVNERSKRKSTALSSLATSKIVATPPKSKDINPQNKILSTIDKLKSRTKPSEVKAALKKPQKTQQNPSSSRRSVRSSTAISTLASDNAATQAAYNIVESSDDDVETSEKESDDGEFETVQKKSRGRSKAEPTPLSPNNPFAAITREYKEKQKLAAKLKRKRKSSLSPDPEDRPRLLTEEENDRLFDSLFDAGSSPPPPTPPPPVTSKKSSRSSRTSLSDQKQQILDAKRKSISIKNDKKASPKPLPKPLPQPLQKPLPLVKPTSTKEDSINVPKSTSSPSNISPASLKWIKSTTTTPSTSSSSPRVIAPWRQICESSKQNKSNNDDIYEFGGPSEGVSEKKTDDDPHDIVTRGKSREILKSETSPERKMFMIAKHGAYSGQLAGLKRKLEQSSTKSQEQQRSPTRLMFGSPRREVTSPEHPPSQSPKHETSQKNGSPRHETNQKGGSPSHKTGSPRIDPSQRMGLPKLYSKPRLGSQRLGGTIKGSLLQNQSHQLSLTSLASDYNIVAAVDKYHSTGGAAGAGMAPELNSSLDLSTGETGENKSGSDPAHPQENIRRKSFLLSRIFSKPPSKDQDEDGDDDDDDNASSADNSIESEEKEDDRKLKKKKQQVLPQNSSSKRPSRRATQNISLKEASSDSESVDSGTSSFRVENDDKQISQSRGNTSIVCTSCHKDDVNLVKQLVKKLGSLTFSTSVGPNTSHVVTGEGKRTLNLLKGLLQGCWIVSKDWILSSLENGTWVNEEPFEMVNFSPAVRNIRLEKESNNGGEFKSELFRDIGSVYISDQCRAPSSDLRQLIISGGGDLSPSSRTARIVVGEVTRGGAQHCVTEKWVLDSVQYHSVMPFSDYPLT